MLNYLGQGAFVLGHPAAVKNPFFEAVPEWALYPMIVLATMAAVIASQAVITGAYSVARQAMQLGYIPRMQIKHTSQRHHRPDLRAVHQLAADDRGAGGGADVPQLDRAGLRLRHLGVGDDADRHPAAGAGGTRAVAALAHLGAAAVRAVLRRRRRFRHRQRRQVLRRRLVPGGAGPARVHPAAHLAPRPRAAA